MVNEKCKWCTDLEGCLSFIMHKVQDAEGMQTECWNLWLFNLSNFMSNHYTNLTSVSFDSFSGSNRAFQKGPIKKWKEKILKLNLIAGPVKEWQNFLSTFLRSGNYESSSFNSHSFVHAVIAAQPLQSDMQFCSLTKMQNQQRTEK